MRDITRLGDHCIHDDTRLRVLARKEHGAAQPSPRVRRLERACRCVALHNMDGRETGGESDRCVNPIQATLTNYGLPCVASLEYLIVSIGYGPSHCSRMDWISARTQDLLTPPSLPHTRRPSGSPSATARAPNVPSYAISNWRPFVCSPRWISSTTPYSNRLIASLQSQNGYHGIWNRRRIAKLAAGSFLCVRQPNGADPICGRQVGQSFCSRLRGGC